jgi:hypothetical protein
MGAAEGLRPVTTHCVEIGIGEVLVWPGKTAQYVAAHRYPGAALIAVNGTLKKSMDPRARYCQAWVPDGHALITLIEVIVP